MSRAATKYRIILVAFVGVRSGKTEYHGVAARECYGLFAVHRCVQQDETDGGLIYLRGYQITHIPTGYKAHGSTPFTLRQAREIAKGYATIPGIETLISVADWTRRGKEFKPALLDAYKRVMGAI